MEIRSSEKAQNGYRAVRRIGMLHFAGILVYALILELLARTLAREVLMRMDLLRPALVGISIAIFFFAGHLRTRMLIPAGLSSVIDQALVPGERLQHMTRASVLVFVLCDAVALFGLVALLLGGGRADFHIFPAMSAIFLLILFPRPDQWNRWYSARGSFR